jgi:quinol-cytochrome oxidoreductase complex cytochrome b subunit
VEQQNVGIQEQKLSVGDGFIGMLNVFVDPKATAKRIPAPLSWLWPIITLTIIYLVTGYLMLPYIMNLIDVRINQQVGQQNTTAEQAERARAVTHAIYQYYPLAIPVIVIVFILFFAWLVSAMASMAGLRTKFRDIFSLMAACSLIPALQSIAIYIVLRTKGDEITSQDQLTPPFGLDIFLQNIHGALLGLVNFFSIFQIWYLVVLTFALAYLGKSSKGKAFFAITPAWVLPLVIKIVQSMFQGSQGS